MAALPLFALLFIGLSMLDQRETFAPLLGLSPEASAPAGPEADLARGAAAERTVRDYNAALAESQRTGAPGALTTLAAPVLTAELGAELSFSRGQRDPPLELIRLEVLSVEPAPGAPGSFTVLTDESWAAAEPAGKSSRLRFRYTVAPAAGELRVEAAVPVLPEPRP